MRYIVAGILTVGLLFTSSFAQEKPGFKDLKDKESYSMGYQFGQSLKSQGVEINYDVYTSGLRDSLGGAKPAMSPEEMQTTVTDLQKRLAAARQKEIEAIAEKNLAAGKAFMEENKKKEGVVTLPSGLQYKVLKKGTGKTPKATDQVTVNYKGTLINGTEFDSTYKDGKPVTFSANGVIKGWTEALQLMKEGSKWQLFIPPDLAYGNRGLGPIPPNSTLVFEVELLSIK